MFILNPESFLLFEILIKFELFWVFTRLTLFNQLEMLRRLIFVYVDFQVYVLDKFGASFSRLEIMNQHILGAGRFYALRENFLLSFQNNSVSNIFYLQFVEIFSHISCVTFHKFLESCSPFCLGALPEKLVQTVLQNFVLKIIRAKSLLLLGVLPNYCHDFTK